MTAQNILAFGSAGHETFLPPMSPMKWLRDIAAHMRLMVDCHQIQAHQTELMERLRAARADEARTVSVRMAGDQLFISEGADLTVMEEELGLLDHRLAVCRAEMIALEGRVLTHPPQDADEVAILLQFLGGVLREEHRMDGNYLADLLDDFADVCMPVPQVAVAEMH